VIRREFGGINFVIVRSRVSRVKIVGNIIIIFANLMAEMCSKTLLEMLFPLCAMNTVLNSCSVAVNALVERYVFIKCQSKIIAIKMLLYYTLLNTYHNNLFDVSQVGL